MLACVLPTGFTLHTHLLADTILHKQSVNGTKTDSCGVPASKNNTPVFESPRQIVKLSRPFRIFLACSQSSLFYFMVEGKKSG